MKKPAASCSVWSGAIRAPTAASASRHVESDDIVTPTGKGLSDIQFRSVCGLRPADLPSKKSFLHAGDSLQNHTPSLRARLFLSRTHSDLNLHIHTPPTSRACSYGVRPADLVSADGFCGASYMVLPRLPPEMEPVSRRYRVPRRFVINFK